MIYFLQEIDNPQGPIKIGYAAVPEARLPEVQTGYPGKLAVLHCMEGGRVDEAREQARWSHLRIYGEWFKASVDLVTYVRAKPTKACDTVTQLHRTEDEALALLNEYWPEFGPYERTGKGKRCPRCWKHGWFFLEKSGKAGTVIVWDGWPPRDSAEYGATPFDVFMSRQDPWRETVGCGYDDPESGG